MQFWKPHALATPHEGQLDLKLGDKVRATTDLPGVPAGTEGKVILANGFNWQRYRVLFENGGELGDLDHRHPYGEGGCTHDHNLAPICRHHHRIRHQAGWTFRRLDNGDHHWTSPLGRTYTTSGRSP